MLRMDVAGDAFWMCGKFYPCFFYIQLGFLDSVVKSEQCIGTKTQTSSISTSPALPGGHILEQNAHRDEFGDVQGMTPRPCSALLLHDECFAAQLVPQFLINLSNEGL